MESDIRFCPCGRIAKYGLRCDKHRDKILDKPKKIAKYSGYSEAYIKSKGAERSDD